MNKVEIFGGIGNSKVMEELSSNIKRISLCVVNVLISGESGTGKELAARAIHYQSCRVGKPFIPVSCGAVPENLFENELFGHVKGAFTGAGMPQNGVVKEAEGGTLFLDEIGAVSSYIQVKLLRLLQEKEYKSLGDSKARKADIRIIAATNEDLRMLIKKGMFREDLFYRLNIVSVHIPPLRERKDDIPLLVEHFSEKYSREYNKPLKKFSDRAVEALVSFHWPGNIRELENKIQQAIVLSRGLLITAQDLKLELKELKSKKLKTRLENFKQARNKIISAFEKNYLTKLLNEFNGDMVSAAACAGKSRTALWNMLTKYNLHPREFRPL
ncbi:MAG: sigma-54-dependent Fis family transcriptional regulator [Candidatus Aminicenantes bacterium]|nr:sigma-54-dependent Fis family transcriptional regulator [Candidatus Aminicenantes bacterium]